MSAAVQLATRSVRPDWRRDGQAWLDDHDVSHTRVAELVGSNRYQVDRWFKGEAAPSLDHLDRMREALPGLWMVVMGAHVWPHAIDTSATEEAAVMEQLRQAHKETAEALDALMEHAAAGTRGTADKVRKEAQEAADKLQRIANSVKA